MSAGATPSASPDRDGLPARDLRARRLGVSLMGLVVDPMTQAELVTRIITAVEAGRGGWVVTANLEILRQYVRSPVVRALVNRAQIVVSDGMPLIWAARLQGTALPGRVTGSDLVPVLSAAAAAGRRTVYLLGETQAARRLAEEELLRRNPTLRIVGAMSPPFGFERDPEELERVRQDLLRAMPDIVYVALGFPKQELLIDRLRREFPSTWFIGVGKSLGFLAGDVRRAPPWLSDLGLEWAHRLAQEPRRLARRYLVDGIPFAALLFGDALSVRLRRRSRLYVRR